MYPLIIQSIAAEQVRDRHVRAARARLARQTRQRRAPKTRTGRPLPLRWALRAAKA